MLVIFRVKLPQHCLQRHDTGLKSVCWSHWHHDFEVHQSIWARKSPLVLQCLGYIFSLSLDKAMIVCNFEEQMMGQLAYLTVNHVQDQQFCVFLGFPLSNTPAKSVSTKHLIPFDLLVVIINPLSLVLLDYPTIICLTAFSWLVFGPLNFHKMWGIDGWQIDGWLYCGWKVI